MTLNPEHPEYRSRFSVESDDGNFELMLEFETTTDADPSLDLQAIGDSAAKVTLPRTSAPHTSENLASRSVRVQVDCPDEFPCVAQFEAIATANTSTASTVRGVLSVTAAMYEHGSKSGGTYLAIEPL